MRLYPRTEYDEETCAYIGVQLYTETRVWVAYISEKLVDVGFLIFAIFGEQNLSEHIHKIGILGDITLLAI